MNKEIYNTNDIIDVINIAKQNNYKITIFSQGNSDESSYTSNTKFIKIINKMDKIIEININSEYVIVESNVTWLQLIEELDKYDYTIYSSQSGLTFSIGGSLCGNAHGRKTEFPMIKDTIIEFNFIDGNGSLHTINEYNSIFNAMAGSLGLLGIITTIKIRIKKRYNLNLRLNIIPLNQNSINYINELHNDNNVCMINFQCCYFNKINEIMISTHYYCDNKKNTNFDKNIYNKNLQLYYTIILIIFYIMSKFDIFNKIRWQIEKYSLQLNINNKCINVNNCFDNWSKPYLSNFKIIEFFFPKNHFLYCQNTIMNIFNKYMRVLSSGSRIVYEKNYSIGFIRFSHSASKQKPYLSLVINFILIS